MPRNRKVAVKAPEPEKAEESPKVRKTHRDEKPSKKLKHEPEWLRDHGLTVATLILSIQKTDCNSAKVITELTKLYKRVIRFPIALFAI